MKFVHMADCHVGGWREPKMRKVSDKAFASVIDYCLKEDVDFVLISGDLFDTALPAIDSLKLVVDKLKQLKDRNIPTYIIAGSHDFSPSGKTMLNVLESADLVVNVSKGKIIDDKLKLEYTLDKNTGTKIMGLLGKKGGLEKNYYYNLIVDKNITDKSYKIFMFHSTLNELKPQELIHIDGMNLSLLPTGFNYYAGGHMHITKTRDVEGYHNIVYPGPIFPTSFSELEKLKYGSFCLVRGGVVQHLKIEPHPIFSVKIDADNKPVEEVEKLILKELEDKELNNAIVTLRISGCLKTGKPSEVNFKKILDELYSKGVYFVMKNTIKLVSKEFEEIKTSEGSVEEIEESLIKEHSGQLKVFNSEEEVAIAKELIRTLSAEKQEGERILDFETRLKGDVDKVLGL